MSMIQLTNLRDELTGLVESRFGSLQDQIGDLPDSFGNRPPATGNLVTLDGSQTITGNKTFSGINAFLEAVTFRGTEDGLGGGQIRLKPLWQVGDLSLSL